MVKKIKIFTSILLVLFLFLLSFSLSSSSVASNPTYFGDGNDGSLTINTDTVDNPIDSPAFGVAGTNTLSATNVSFSAGQRILIHQSQGTNAGAWEKNEIASYTVGTITTTSPLTNTYSLGAQVLVLKEYTNVTVESGKTWTAKAWNGTVGGILAFFANGTLTVNGTISANGKGYRGGATNFLPGMAGIQGEGTPGAGVQSVYANGSGGGGGTSRNLGGTGDAAPAIWGAGGGGGGGNGQAGNESGPTGPDAPTGGGNGFGGIITGTADLTTANFGGGGGAGGFNLGSVGGTAGGNGGGIIFLFGATLTINNTTGNVIANGANATSATDIGGNGEGGGGGGAGGSVLIESQTTTLNTIRVTVTGGAGGSVTGAANSNGGAAAGGGRIHINFINQPPIANAGGPYSVPEGRSVELTGLGSDPTNDPLTYAWDLDNNGIFETPGQNVTFLATGLDGPSSPTVVLKVCDDKGACTTSNATVTVTNVVPTVGSITASIDPVQINTIVFTSASFTDPGVLDTHTAVWDWGDGTSSAGVITESNGSGSVVGNHTYTAAGVYTITLTVTDKDGASGQSIFQYVVVFDLTAGFVTGAGMINSPFGAYPQDPSLSGRANFGFVVKYLPGDTAPNGGSRFKFRLADINFASTSYQWLVISGSKATFKGVGTNNGSGDYTFFVSTIDGQTDKYRIKITDNLTNTVFYDNEMGNPETADSTTPLVAGSVVIH